MHAILIPGFWLTAASWSPVVPALEAAGHSVHALTLPGLDPDDPERESIGLHDQAAFVVALVDEIVATHGESARIAVVGHSGGSAVAQEVADARPGSIARVIHVDAVPFPAGSPVNAELPVVDGLIPLPAWSLFDEAELAGLDDETRERMRRESVAIPVGVAQEPRELSNEGRFAVPATIITSTWPAEQLRVWIGGGTPEAGEVALTRDLTILELPTGHWPQFSRPAELADRLVEALAAD